MLQRHRAYRLWFFLATAVICVTTAAAVWSLAETKALSREIQEQQAALGRVDHLHTAIQALESAELRAIATGDGQAYGQLWETLKAGNQAADNLCAATQCVDDAGLRLSEVDKAARGSFAELNRWFPIWTSSPAERIRAAQAARKTFEAFFTTSMRAHHAFEASLLGLTASTARADTRLDMMLTLALGSAAFFLIGGYMRLQAESDRRTKAQRDIDGITKRLLERTRLLNLAPAMVVEFDNGRILSWTEGATRLFGWTRQEAEGQILHELLKTKHSVPREAIGQALSESGEWSGEATEYSRSGKKLEVILHCILHAEPGHPKVVLEFATNITERKQAEMQLRLSEERWQLAMSASMNGIWDFDMVHNRLFLSQRSKQIIGYEDGELSNEAEEWEARMHPDDRGKFIAALEDHIAGKAGAFYFECRMHCKDGSYKWVLMKGRALRDDSGTPLRLIGTVTDITTRKQYSDELAYDASHDPLTGLLNRRSLEQQFEALSAELAGDGASLALLMCDLDQFKRINDTYGHQAGDSVLAGFANVLRQHTRSEDLACRLGGDEFTVLISRLDVGEVAEIANRISSCFAQMRFQSDAGREFSATVSIGVGQAGSPVELSQLLRLADHALYEVKACRRSASRSDGTLALQADLQLSEC